MNTNQKKKKKKEASGTESSNGEYIQVINSLAS
jgi:hypothetical protein